MTSKIVYLVYDGFELIDLAGPSAVFNLANELEGAKLYENCVTSAHGGLTKTNTGLELNSLSLTDQNVTNKDTILTMGGEVKSLFLASQDLVIHSWLKQMAPIAGRIGSICTGTFVLAACGLLTNRKATTHWRECALLSKQYGSVDVVEDALYINDQNIWTSAGGTAGVDMALAIVAIDHSAHLAARIAKNLVVYLHRPGYQSQFSDVLNAQEAKHGEFSDLIAWLEVNISKSIKVEDMAERSGMSLRSFHRKFTKATGTTPFKFIELARMRRAKELLESGMPPKVISRKVGFSSLSGFQTAFKKHFGISPQMQSLMHGI